MIIDCLPDFEGNIIVNINVVSAHEAQVSNHSLFSRITQTAYDKGAAQTVEDELRSAIVSAPKLVKVIKTNEALGYLDTKNLTSKELFDLLDAHFHLPFKYRQFTSARNI